MSIDEAGDIHIWTARPQEVDPAQWPQLTAWLDEPERLYAEKFRHVDDRHAYTLAHVLRRLAVATALAVPPASLVFSSEASGKPILTTPPDDALYFSHAHSRMLVACAVTRIGPVGIDTEPLDQDNADMALLRGLVALPDAQQRRAAPGSDHTPQFFFYWTLLEAYWKSKGRGLSLDHPILYCQPTSEGWFAVSTSKAGADVHDGQGEATWATALQGPPDCMLMLAVTPSPAPAARSPLRLAYHTPVFEPAFAPIFAAQDVSQQKTHPSQLPYAPASPASSMQAAICVSA